MGEVVSFPQSRRVRIVGEPADGIDGDHIGICPVCGATFDYRDLGQVFDHFHDGPKLRIVPAPS